MEKRSVIDLFAEKAERRNDNSNSTSTRSVSNVQDSVKNGQREQVAYVRQEEGIQHDPISLMNQEDAKQVTASKVDMNEAIGELSSLWSGNKSVGENYLKYASKKDLKGNENNEEGDE